MYFFVEFSNFVHNNEVNNYKIEELLTTTCDTGDWIC